MGKIGDFDPNELDLSFPTSNDCAKFHQILFKIATAGAMTDRHTNTQIHRQRDASNLIICSMLCNSNGTDNYADVCVCVTLMKFVFCFLTVGYFVRSRLCYSVASVVCPTVRVVSDVRIVAKRCVLEQKLLFTTYSKSYMRNRLVLK